MRHTALLMTLAFGCDARKSSTPSTLERHDTGMGPHSFSGDDRRLVEDLIRTHQEVFDRFVLFTIADEDCEYPYPDTFGPETRVFVQEDYPHPDIDGAVEVTAQMTHEDGVDLWTMSTTYTDLSATEALSEGARPTINGVGIWTVSVPGRSHTLTATVSSAHISDAQVSLRFEIAEYRDSGYGFDVSGRVSDVDIEDRVTVRNLCPSDG